MAKKAVAKAEEYTFANWRHSMDTHGNTTKTVLYIVVLVFIVLLIRDISHQKDDKKVYEQQNAVVKLFDVTGSAQARIAQRRELAHSILIVKRYGNEIEEFKDPGIEKHVRATAQTGEPLNLHLRKPSFLAKFLHTLLVCLIVLACLSSLALGGLHCLSSFDEKAPIGWMPWNRLWAWILPLCAPWLIPFLIISVCYIAWLSRAEIRKFFRENRQKKRSQKTEAETEEKAVQ